MPRTQGPEQHTRLMSCREFFIFTWKNQMKTKAFKPTRNKLAQAVALSIFTLAANHANATDYTFSDLGTFNGPYPGAGANGINNLGQVVGYGNGPAGPIPLIWNGDTATGLELGAGGEGALGIGINDLGQSTGYNSLARNLNQSNGIRWDGITATQLDNLGAAHFTVGHEINNQGQIVGASGPSDGHGLPTRWDGTSITTLGTLGGELGSASGINDSGQAVGYSSTTGDLAMHATYWAGNTVTDLGTLGGNLSYAQSINNSGQIAGRSLISDEVTTHAAYWSSFAASPTDLGSLGVESNAEAINNLGQIVGASTLADGSLRATLWEGNSIIDLNNYLPADIAAAGWFLIWGTDINDNGTIIGWAQQGLDPNAAAYGSFKLTPSAVPIPGAVWLFGSALAGFMGMNRRKQALASSLNVTK